MISCANCEGQGTNSIHYQVEPFLKISSAIHVQDLEQEPKTLTVKADPLKLATAGHIDVKVVKAPEPEEDEESCEISYYQDEDAFIDSPEKKVFYEATVAWAVAETTINDKPYNIAFIGHKGAVVDSGKFMDDILEKPASLLAKAAKGQGIVSSLLKDSCQWGVSRETLSAIVQGSRKKAMKDLAKKYKLGFSKAFLQSYIQNTYLSLKQITKRPRYIGLGIGLFLSAIIYYYWFLNGGRNLSLNNPDNIRLVMDSIPFIIGVLLTLMTTKGVGFITYRSVMKDIGIASIKLPPAGKAALYGLIGNLLLWGGFLFWEFVSLN
jgi:hypothetical protein